MYRQIVIERSALYALHLTFKTAKNLCPNLQKPPLPSKIPGYAPDHVNNLLKKLLAEMRGAKNQITLQITFHKEIENNETKY